MLLQQQSETRGHVYKNSRWEWITGSHLSASHNLNLGANAAAPPKSSIGSYPVHGGYLDCHTQARQVSLRTQTHDT